MSEENKSELYSKHQALFDDRFAEIMIKTFIGFDRAKFEQLSDNDSVEENTAINITWYEDDTEWVEGDISYFSDGMPALDEED